jgi:hypothetical protein
MLIFKNNLYNKNETGLTEFFRSPDPGFDLGFNPSHFLASALAEEQDTLDFLERQPKEYWMQDAKKFFPHAYKTGGLPIIKEILSILNLGHADPDIWYSMNSYHFCFLFDVLTRFAFNYNHDNSEERMRTLPELSGKPVYLDLIVKNYFFHTHFLTSEDEFNALTADQKQQKGFKDPCLFSVINGLAPTREERELKKSRDYPYSIYV